MMKCDPDAGHCTLSGPECASEQAVVPQVEGMAVHYIGDPMCSWCWGIAPVISQVADFCQQAGITFSITAGGLRAGGGDPWNDAFRHFLREEWSHIASVTGQPFGFTLLQLSHFDYDTEPACRAVGVARQLMLQRGQTQRDLLTFFAAVQQKFYVEGADPKETGFYRQPCLQSGLDFALFSQEFNSGAAQKAVEQDFVKCRQWGVRSFPTLLLEKNGAMSPLSMGYTTAEPLITQLKARMGS
ncbi:MULTISPECIES: DsbA family protein [unclassified Serratia (in: enterobacteria)]|uniref:DsbA family protein n=1 Tax=unclassified Serratia (in: enterobacteria) TaxID=2647522 RepID=UPI00050342F9|nr:MULTISPECIES: DsbA family protein [unclassified Serratia (in: enterobacteria)]KFK96594.1 protein-disulfide isomerase [Serratia sp. Ag2]KFK99786.1 protein-disulfide isomerase [Serratia sp. Ag1]